MSDIEYKTSPLKAIRQNCLECVGDENKVKEVENCQIVRCALHPYRFGKNPYRKPPSEKQLAAARANAAKLHGSSENME